MVHPFFKFISSGIFTKLRDIEYAHKDALFDVMGDVFQLPVLPEMTSNLIFE